MNEREPEPIPRENPFRAMGRMLKTSVGRLPAHLVIIFFISLVITILFGVFLQFTEKASAVQNGYLPERLAPEEERAALREDQLKGVWLHKTGESLITMRIGGGIFEIISQEAGVPFARYFIRGGYKIDGNVLVMQERKDLGTPYDPEHFEYKFYPLSFRNINLYAENDGRLMVWQTPPREAKRLKEPEDILKIIFGPEIVWARISDQP